MSTDKPSTSASRQPDPHQSAHPAIFTLLILPMGITGGYVTVTLGYLFSQAGVSVERIAALSAASLLPHIFKFIWSPLADTTLTFKRWYMIAAASSALSLLATGFMPINAGSIALMTALVIFMNFNVTFLCMATEGLMAYDVSESEKGRAGGFFQAGNLGGAGLGGGAGLWLAQRLSDPWMVSAILASVCLLSGIGLFFMNEPKNTIREHELSHTYKNLAKDVWSTVKNRRGLLALVLCFLPLGTGAASNLWSAVARDWSASADTVALVTGVAAGLLSALGCFIGGWFSDRMNRQHAYLLFGLLGAMSVVAMAYMPKTQTMYIVWTSVYAITSGLAYAGFSAFVLEAIGKGAAATKYNIYAALSNAPIYLMTYVDGWAHTRWGPKGMLNTEAVFAVIAVLFFIALQSFKGRPQLHPQS